jgi:hypothetical protein
MDENEIRYKKLRVDCKSLKAHVLRNSKEQAVASISYRIRVNAVNLGQKPKWREPVYNELSQVCDVLKSKALFRDCTITYLINRVAAVINSNVIEDVCEALRQL